MAEKRIEQAGFRKKALSFIDHDMENFYVVHTVLQPQIDLQHLYLHDNEPGWDLRALCLAAHGQQRAFRVAEVHTASKVGGRFHGFLVAVMERMQDAKLWAHVAHTERNAANIAMTSLRCAAICYELIIQRTLAFPYRLFSVLIDASEATNICNIYANHPCLLDPLSLQVLQAYPRPDDLLGEEAMLLLEGLALNIMGNTFDIERLHSRNARRATRRVTHAPSLQQLAVFHQARATSPLWLQVAWSHKTRGSGGLSTSRFLHELV